jgi:hypothetical protein
MAEAQALAEQLRWEAQYSPYVAASPPGEDTSVPMRRTVDDRNNGSYDGTGAVVAEGVHGASEMAGADDDVWSYDDDGGPHMSEAEENSNAGAVWRGRGGSFGQHAHTTESSEADGAPRDWVRAEPQQGHYDGEVGEAATGEVAGAGVPAVATAATGGGSVKQRLEAQAEQLAKQAALLDGVVADTAARLASARARARKLARAELSARAAASEALRRRSDSSAGGGGGAVGAGAPSTWSEGQAREALRGAESARAATAAELEAARADAEEVPLRPPPP